MTLRLSDAEAEALRRRAERESRSMQDVEGSPSSRLAGSSAAHQLKTCLVRGSRTRLHEMLRHGRRLGVGEWTTWCG